MKLNNIIDRIEDNICDKELLSYPIYDGNKDILIMFSYYVNEDLSQAFLNNIYYCKVITGKIKRISRNDSIPINDTLSNKQYLDYEEYLKLLETNMESKKTLIDSIKQTTELVFFNLYTSVSKIVTNALNDNEE